MKGETIMKDDVKKCCICGREFVGWGNNPWPVVKDEDAECCDDCDNVYVIPARIEEMNERNLKEIFNG